MSVMFRKVRIYHIYNSNKNLYIDSSGNNIFHNFLPQNYCEISKTHTFQIFYCDNIKHRKNKLKELINSF